MKIFLEYGPSDNCPVIAEGIVEISEAEKYSFYFKSRGTKMRFFVDSLDYVYVEEYNGSAKEDCDDDLAAGFATKEECLTFINKAAEKFLISLNKL